MTNRHWDDVENSIFVLFQYARNRPIPNDTALHKMGNVETKLTGTQYDSDKLCINKYNSIYRPLNMSDKQKKSTVEICQKTIKFNDYETPVSSGLYFIQICLHLIY